ncbi:MAG: hypothetical protein P8Q48_06625 [Paracoccaceae bacterium]|nr:hypothetical protein [Paracoccaceae bacterium]
MAKTSKSSSKVRKTKPQIIKFETFNMPGPPPVPIILTAKNKAWANVIQTLLDLGVDKWDAEYHDPSIMDGSGWLLSICSKELNIQSSGMNAYPEKFDAVRELIERAAATAPPPAKATHARKPRKCSNCGAAPVGSVLYGMPSLSHELMEKERRGEVVFGGCVIEMDGSQPSWKCTTCEMEFYKTT